MPFVAQSGEVSLWDAQVFLEPTTIALETTPQRLTAGVFYVWVDLTLGTMTSFDLYMETSIDGGQTWDRIYDGNQRSMRIEFTSDFSGCWHFFGFRQDRVRVHSLPLPGSLWRIAGEATGGALATCTVSLKALPFEHRTLMIGSP